MPRRDGHIMKFIPEEYTLVAAVLGAVFVKLLLTPAKTIMSTIAIAFSGMFMALAFTDPVMWYFGLDPMMLVPVASVLTFTGDGIARQIIKFGQSPDDAKSVLRNLFELLAVWNSKSATKPGDDDVHRDPR